MKGSLLFAAGALWAMALCATPIRFGTWNIRLATMDNWEKDPRFPKWEARMPYVTGLIKDKGFDLMGLQEVCTQQADFIRKAFPEWGLVGVATNDTERSRTSHANGIFFRKDRFRVDEWGWFGLSETPDVPGVKSWGTMCVRACTWARMTDVVDGRKFLFFNTHFDHRSQTAREKGMELVLAKIAEKNREGVPVILCGDFNSRVESPQIQLAKKTLARAYEISATPPKGPFRTDNCWKFVSPEQENEKAGNRIDHIFLTPGTKVASYETFGDFYGDNFYPSDHFPIKVLMEWPSSDAETLVIAERGKESDYAIVMPANPSPSHHYAAVEFRDFIAAATGEKLSVITHAAAMPQKAVVIVDADIGGDGDGFRLKVEGGRLYITGGCRGALYGVYEVLERFVGCRWYSSWRTVVPRRDRIEVPADLDETQTPAFAMREPYWYDVLQHPEFAARLRVNSRSWRRMGEKYGGDPYRFGGGLGSCHTFDKLLSPEKHFDSHPEYFSLVKGRRMKNRTQLCLTNPDVLRIVTSNVLARIRKDPGAKFYGVSQNDWYNFCECPNCKAVDDEEGSHAGTMVRFVNAIAEAVEKEFPNAIIETLAYQYTRKAPKKTKLRHNVIPCLCTIECDFAQPLDKSPFKENIAFRKDIEDWSRMTDFLYIWDYTTDFANYTMPWPNVYALQGNIQFFRRNKVKALFEQGAYQGRHADFAELKAWLLAKWMWNPDLPMKDLLDDFFAGYYGKAAPFVRDYFEAIHKLQAHCSSHPNKPLLIFDSVGSSVLPDAFLDFAEGCWQQALDAVKGDPATSYNVRMAKFSFDYLRLERSHRLLDMRESRPDVPTVDVRGLAQSLLDRMDEAKDIRLAEGDRSALVSEWKKIAKEGIAQHKSGRGELEERDISIAHRGVWGDYVDDPKAEDGRALKLFNTHFEWCATLPMGKIAFEPGKKYRLSARVRVEKARDGEAFWAGVYSKGSSRGRGGVEPHTKDVPDDEYRWYDVLTWVPAPDEFFWIGPGRFTPDGKSAVKGVYLDKIKFTLAE